MKSGSCNRREGIVSYSAPGDYFIESYKIISLIFLVPPLSAIPGAARQNDGGGRSGLRRAVAIDQAWSSAKCAQFAPPLDSFAHAKEMEPHSCVNLHIYNELRVSILNT